MNESSNGPDDEGEGASGDPTAAQPGGDFFAPPPFKAAEALTQLKRQLRDVRPLAERGSGFEINGRAVIALTLTPGTDAIEARLARRAAMSPDWDKSFIRSGAEQRKFLDNVKSRIARWTDDD
ncbi:hypothetical protein BH09PSE5_BH09PSE5_39720 [soil metagenome]